MHWKVSTATIFHNFWSLGQRIRRNFFKMFFFLYIFIFLSTPISLISWKKHIKQPYFKITLINVWEFDISINLNLYIFYHAVWCSQDETSVKKSWFKVIKIILHFCLNIFLLYIINYKRSLKQSNRFQIFINQSW